MEQKSRGLVSSLMTTVAAGAAALRSALGTPVSPVVADLPGSISKLEQVFLAAKQAGGDLLPLCAAIARRCREVARERCDLSDLTVLKRLQRALQTENAYEAGREIERVIVGLTKRRSDLSLPVSAVLRVKNEERNIVQCLHGILGVFAEVIVVDNGSTDRTLERVAAIDSPKIAVFHYPIAIARAGNSYRQELEAGLGSLATYYNFALSKASYDWCFKWDADMVALPALHRAPENDGFRELLASRADVVFITGVDCFDLLSCSPEPRLFRKSVCGYKDSEFWEELRSAPGARISAVKEPVYLHNKFLYDGLDLA